MKQQKRIAKDNQKSGGVPPYENWRTHPPAPYLCISVEGTIKLYKMLDQPPPEFALNFICDILQIPYLKTYEDILWTTSNSAEEQRHTGYQGKEDELR